MNRQGQAAMEFLATYSWAILAVLIAILALATFGFLNPSRFISGQCLLEPGIACVDFTVETERIVLVLQNGIGERITLHQVDAFKNNGNGCSNGNDVALEPQSKAIIPLIGCNNGNAKEKYIGNLNVTYSKESITHSSKGSLIQTITPTNSITSSIACQNADDADLCSGLDVVYGIGYSASCCTEWSLCCS